MRKSWVMGAVALAVVSVGLVAFPGVSGARAAAAVAGPRDCPATGPDPLTLSNRRTRAENFIYYRGAKVTVQLRSGNAANGVQYAWAVLLGGKAPYDSLRFVSYWNGSYPTECGWKYLTRDGTARTQSFRTSASASVTFAAVAYVSSGDDPYYELATTRW
jgi:D-serine deaminase-like pyridoxal phosphate-dependent protein